MYGGVCFRRKRKIREITEKLTTLLLKGLMTFSTGINIYGIYNIIFASPSKSRIRNLQSIGRGLRLKDNNSCDFI